jgi:hypothetical protein
VQTEILRRGTESAALQIMKKSINGEEEASIAGGYSLQCRWPAQQLFLARITGKSKRESSGGPVCTLIERWKTER